MTTFIFTASNLIMLWTAVCFLAWSVLIVLAGGL
jgi:hypothetical protein